VAAEFALPWQDASNAQLLQLLRATLAALRALRIAGSSGLALLNEENDGQEFAAPTQQVVQERQNWEQEFVGALLHINTESAIEAGHGGEHTAPDSGLVSGCTPAGSATLSLLWQLVEQHATASAGSGRSSHSHWHSRLGSSSAVARKACDLLLCCLQQQPSHLQGLVLPAALASLPSVGTLAQLLKGTNGHPFYFVSGQHLA